jgi:hypothetical protein
MLTNDGYPLGWSLTDWAGRAIREDKSGVMPSVLVPNLERLNIDPKAWLDSVKNYDKKLLYSHWNKGRD